MRPELSEVRRAAGRVLAQIEADPRYGHTSHLLVDVAGVTVVDEHRHGRAVEDVFSVTKSVLATVLGRLAALGRLSPLDSPVSEVLAVLRGTPAEQHTWRHLLTMTRGARTDGPWEIDAVTALPRGQVGHAARAPQLVPAGERSGYDNAGTHLLSASVAAIIGEPTADFAARELFAPLGIDDAHWLSDPDGVSYGYGHLALSADAMRRIGRLWLAGGTHAGRRLIDPAFLTAMVTPATPGGPPEGLPYGFLTWIGPDYLLAGGWAGQHLLVFPLADTVVVTTGDPGFEFGPPPRDRLPPDWRPALDLIRTELLPVLGASPGASG